MSSDIKKADVFMFHALDALTGMTLEHIESLWELVPTERQREYKRIYDKTRRDEGASISDALELKMVTQLLDRYQQRGLVPIGSYWVPTPVQIQKAASENNELKRDEDETAKATFKPSMVMVALGACCFLLFGFLILRGFTGRDNKTAANLNRTPSATATLRQTLTPTPIALEAQDSIIRSGDNASGATTLYPVNLRVMVGSETQPRVFVVQRRIIQTTEWNYDDNPDTASYISGLMVRPVLGIPWSEENEALFQTLKSGSSFVLQMNTGATQRFTFASQQVVNRSDTDAFSQVAPGLVLVLMGRHDLTTEEPAPDRTIVLGSYVHDLELSSGKLSGIDLPQVDTPTPTLTPTPVQRIDVQLISAFTSEGQAVVRMRIYNGQNTVRHIDGDSLWIAYGYSERPVGPHVSAQIQPFDLEAGQALDLTVTFAWRGEPFATVGTFDTYQFAITFAGGNH